MTSASVPPQDLSLEGLLERALLRVGQALPTTQTWSTEPCAARLRQVALASDFFVDTLVRQPALLAHFNQDNPLPLPPPVLEPDQAQCWPVQLRRYRSAESARLVWRDVLGLDDVDATLTASTHLAETCLQLALQALEQQFQARYGCVVAADGHVQRLVVFGLGKLGGGELNFSSDVDLVYAYPQPGQSDGVRMLVAEEYFARLGQQLAKLLEESTADGFCHRVDLRLRPFGKAGRIAWSFAAMDHYFQREGRDWERYAWLKARAVAGDTAAGETWLETLRPFVYRRYLDFTALDGLRELKAAIAAEVARHDRLDDIKRGPGGIREIEFLVQSLQLIRGGREPSLRVPGLLPALQALVAQGQIDPADGQALAHAYRFLRRLENRLQMLRDAQTHTLPKDTLDRARIASSLGYADWEALLLDLQLQRARVAAEFAELLSPRTHADSPEAVTNYWRALPGGDATPLMQIGWNDPSGTHQVLSDFARSPGVRGLSGSARARLDRVMPALLHTAARTRQPDAALHRVLGLLRAILRRTSYLALLDEQPSALLRLVDILSRSALLAERLVAYPLLLDELLDTRVAGPLPDRDAVHAACAAMLAIDDPETALRALNEQRQALSFRIALGALDGRLSAVDSTRQLAWLAEAVLHCVLVLARQQLAAAHGDVPGGRFAIVSYGSLGGTELSFGSDLDVVFLYDHPGQARVSDGLRPLEAAHWFTRLAQKILALLGAQTGAGHLYSIDVRLRPDGGKGPLVSSLSSYRHYQCERAWTWEHQALVRARGIAGEPGLLADFKQVRAQILNRARDMAALHTDVLKMRARMRAELDRSDVARFDLKQGAGGLVDLEFLLQANVLKRPLRDAGLHIPCDTPRLIDRLSASGCVPLPAAMALHAAHAVLLDASLACTLDRRPRLVPLTPALEQARQAIARACTAAGLPFA